MELISVYIMLFSIIVVTGCLFSRTVIPISLLLVIAGMFLSLIPHFPRVHLNPELVLNVFLPMLVYQISAYAAWEDFKKNTRPILLLSVGHVIFIACCVAVVIHALIPQLGWPLSFVLGAIVSPPDTVAIVSIAEKIRMPRKVVAILEGEGLLNDATALILFRFSLIAAISHEFVVSHAIFNFFAVVIGETLYGFILGHILAALRQKIHNPILHIAASLLTPFLAYLPAAKLGGSGVLATVVTGFVIGQVYATKFTPEFRLISRAVWPAVAFIIEGFLFLLVGLDMHFIVGNISIIPWHLLLFYSLSVIFIIVIGRFFWVYVMVSFLPRFLFPSLQKKDPYPPWQFPFVTSWAGMRGGVSLAAALAIPHLPVTIEGVNLRDLIIFLVFCVIVSTLVLQGLSLPWLLKKIGIQKFSRHEEYSDHVNEISARISLVTAALDWLTVYEKNNESHELACEIKVHIHEYELLKSQLQERLENHDGEENDDHDSNNEMIETIFLLSQIIEIEREELLRLWQQEKISSGIRDKLLMRLDHRSQNLHEG